MKSKKNILLLILSIVSLKITILFFVFAFYQRNNYLNKYNKAKELINVEKYDEALEILNTLKDYKDGNELLILAQKEKEYSTAVKLFKNCNYNESLNFFLNIVEYKDSKKYINKCKFNLAVDYYNDENYEEAKPLFEEVGDDDSKWYLAQINVKNLNESEKIIYDKAYEHYKNKQYKEALEDFKAIKNYKKSKELIKRCEDKLRKNLSHVIAAGSNYFLGIINDNSVKFSGDNDYTQGDVDFWKNIISVDGYSECTIGLKVDGTVKTTGTLSKKDKRQIEGLNHVIDIAAGEKFVAALKSNGKVIVKGHNGNGQCDTEDWKDIVDIDCGWGFTVGLDKKGNLHFAGHYNKNEVNHSPKKDEWNDVVKISASGGDPLKHRGGGHVVGLKSNGKVVAVGDNDLGQCNIEDWEDMVAIAAGDWYTVGLTSKGKIKITGKNNPNGIKHTVYKNKKIMSEWNKMNIKDIAAGYGITLVLNENGKLDAMGFVNDKQRTQIKDWSIKLKE